MEYQVISISHETEEREIIAEFADYVWAEIFLSAFGTPFYDSIIIEGYTLTILNNKA